MSICTNNGVTVSSFKPVYAFIITNAGSPP